jgi:hypothetical protein
MEWSGGAPVLPRDYLFSGGKQKEHAMSLKAGKRIAVIGILSERIRFTRKDQTSAELCFCGRNCRAASWKVVWPTRTGCRRIGLQAPPRALQGIAQVNLDTAVQPKTVTFRTNAKLLHAAIVGVNRMARNHGIKQRQSYLRLAKRRL